VGNLKDGWQLLQLRLLRILLLEPGWMGGTS